MDKLPATLTEAFGRSDVRVIWPTGVRADTAVREVPYAERYAASTRVAETPAEMIQQAADDEERRAAAG